MKDCLYMIPELEPATVKLWNCTIGIGRRNLAIRIDWPQYILVNDKISILPELNFCQLSCLNCQYELKKNYFPLITNRHPFDGYFIFKVFMAPANIEAGTYFNIIQGCEKDSGKPSLENRPLKALNWPFKQKFIPLASQSEKNLHHAPIFSRKFNRKSFGCLNLKKSVMFPRSMNSRLELHAPVFFTKFLSPEKSFCYIKSRIHSAHAQCFHENQKWNKTVWGYSIMQLCLKPLKVCKIEIQPSKCCEGLAS